MDDVLRGARQEAARIAVPLRGAKPEAEHRTEPNDTPALRQAEVAAAAAAARDKATGRTGTGNAAGFGGRSRALEAAAKLFLDDDY